MRWRSVSAAVVLLAGTATSCGGDSGPLPVEISVDLQRGQAFTASGEAVDEGLMCASGQRVETGFLDLDRTTPLSLEEFAERQNVAHQTGGEVIEFLLELEVVCADGSGRIGLIEKPDDWWEVAHGVGAYAGVSGQGSVTFELSGAPLEPDDPPEGMPSIVRLTGTVDRSGDG